MDNQEAEKLDIGGRVIKRRPDEAPNVKLAGGAAPLGAGPVTVGMAQIGDLPDEESQRDGFYFPNAQLLTRLFPEHFKLLVDKGRERQAV